MTRPLRHRRTARVLLLDDADRLLLLQVEDEVAPGRPWWVTVGGGLEAGESLATAAVREVAEEVGVALREADLGAHVWTRRARHSYADHVVEQDEDFLLARLPPGAVLSTDGSPELAARWWSVGELVAATATGSDLFWPADLAELLPTVLRAPRSGWPAPRRLPDAVEDAP